MKYFFLLLLLPHTAAFGQNQFFKTYGGTAVEKAWSIAPAPDGFILCGETTSFGAGNKDLLLLRTDHLGDTLWTRVYGGTNEEIGEAVSATADTGFIVVGHTKSAGLGNKDLLAMKIASNGDLQWMRKIGGAGDEEGYSVYPCSDGGYIIAGYTSSFGGMAGNIYLVKLSGAGAVLWTKVFGGAAFDGGYSVQQTSDAGFIIAGVTGSFGAGSYDAFLLKTDSLGNREWSKTYGGNDDDWGYAVKQTADGGYILSGHTHSFGFIGDYDIYLIKTDAQGDTIWTRCYGDAGEDIGWMVEPVADGGYMLAGNTEIPNVDHHNIYLMKTDSIGHMLWGKSYGLYNPSAALNSDVAVSFTSTSDGGYALTGNTNSFGAGNYEAYILKTDATGNGTCRDSVLEITENQTATIVGAFTPLLSNGGNINTTPFASKNGSRITDVCSLVGVADNAIYTLPWPIAPNPADNFLQVNRLETATDFMIINAIGKTMLRISVSPGERIDLTTLPPGLYFLCSDTRHKGIAGRKFLIIRK